MFSWQGEVDVVDEKTGEVVGRKHMCVQAEENVPFGCELGGPRPRTIREEWPLILALLLALFAVPALIVLIIIIGIIQFVSGH